MTDEQIRQNAVKYSEQHCSGYVDSSLVDAYIAGAHSRDEEIEELKKSKGAFLDSVAKHKKAAMELETKLNQLHNPWISVEEKLPEERKDGYSDLVLIRWENNVYDIAHYCHKGYKSQRWEGEYGSGIQTPTHWMPIPELKKGE